MQALTRCQHGDGMPCHAIACCCARCVLSDALLCLCHVSLQESTSGAITLHYTSFSDALGVSPDQLSINTHPMYHVLQGIDLILDLCLLGHGNDRCSCGCSS